MFDPMLHILNIDKDHYVSLTEEKQQGKEKFKAMFGSWKMEFYFIARDDFFDAMDDFVKDYSIDVIITIPRHQSNSTSLLKSTHTKHLAYHSHIPILAAHE
jgi:hypothetical protein